MKRSIEKTYKLTFKEQYIPENPWRPWIKKGETIYLHGKSKRDIIKYFEPKAIRMLRKGKITLKRVL
jgi:hypothetical protein